MNKLRRAWESAIEQSVPLPEKLLANFVYNESVRVYHQARRDLFKRQDELINMIDGSILGKNINWIWG